MESKRKFRRFDLPLVVAFRHTRSAAEYSMGLMKNFSLGGVSLVSYDSSFINKEDLELNLRFPHSDQFIPIQGNVVWKRQAGNKYLAGIKLEIEREDTRSKILDELSLYGNIPKSKILQSKDSDYLVFDDEAFNRIADKGEAGSLEEGAESGLQKHYLQDGSLCRVTFRLPKYAAPDADHVTVVGDFNRWDFEKTPMVQNEDGDFLASVDLTCGQEYKFKYLIDGEHWENGWSVDKYVPNSYGSDDSVVIV